MTCVISSESRVNRGWKGGWGEPAAPRWSPWRRRRPAGPARPGGAPARGWAGGRAPPPPPPASEPPPSSAAPPPAAPPAPPNLPPPHKPDDDSARRYAAPLVAAKPCKFCVSRKGLIARAYQKPLGKHAVKITTPLPPHQCCQTPDDGGITHLWRPAASRGQHRPRGEACCAGSQGRLSGQQKGISWEAPNFPMTCYLAPYV